MDQLAMPATEPERWLPVVGYEGLYEVSNQGRIRSFPRRGTPGVILRPHQKRYLTVNLWRDGKKRTLMIHQLVAAAFLGPRPEGLLVCHGPAGCYENDVANLSYGTPAKNYGPDKHRDATMLIGVRNVSAKLNDELVREMRRRFAAGESKRSLAAGFGVCRANVKHIVNGTTWRHVA